MIQERSFRGFPGLPVVLAGLVAIGLLIWALVEVGQSRTPAWVVAPIVGLVLVLLMLCGLFIVNPNQAKVLQLFGRYVGSAREPGLHWANPFYTKRRISARIRNFESNRLKVNDHEGSPIEIAAVVVWRVVDTAEAAFEVEDYENFVHVQSESALRNLANQYCYDIRDDHSGQPGKSLRANTVEVADQLKKEIQDRLAKAGVEVLEARISHLAYAQEIAAAMLRRQQATAIIAARQKIVEGAVGMVDMALELLKTKNVVDLDGDRKAAMVSNLLVVLCADHEVQPVVNAGTIYQ
jgi:regulator of protease activity HflC (stomatin/prohibitin superfamily)